MGIWWRENKNKLGEWKVLVDAVGTRSADLEDKFLFYRFAAFWTAKILGKGRKLPYALFTVANLRFQLSC